MRAALSAAAVAAIVGAATAPLSAQRPRNGDSRPSEPTPRLPDGTVDLGNEGGIWSAGWVQSWTDPRWVQNEVDPKMTPKALALYNERRETLSKDDPEGFCMPPGVPRYNGTPYPFQIFQLPGRIIILYESMHGYRTIFMDGRKHDPDANPQWLGYSYGHWEGDTLVVEVLSQNGRTWMDYYGHPTSENMRVIERYTRVNKDTLHYEATIIEPDLYEEPWTTSYDIRWSDGQELIEYICNENNRDIFHMDTKGYK